mmetsp:Transcript_35861/g.115605  ORF Transcript_35861/g.115605 Transcript_35861/m.115605 type:complete len:229 (-) Transcript_35861:545-1231(-)
MSAGCLSRCTGSGRRSWSPLAACPPALRRRLAGGSRSRRAMTRPRRRRSSPPRSPTPPLAPRRAAGCEGCAPRAPAAPLRRRSRRSTRCAPRSARGRGRRRCWRAPSSRAAGLPSTQSPPRLGRPCPSTASCSCAPTSPTSATTPPRTRRRRSRSLPARAGWLLRRRRSPRSWLGGWPSSTLSASTTWSFTSRATTAPRCAERTCSATAGLRGRRPPRLLCGESCLEA